MGRSVRETKLIAFYDGDVVQELKISYGNGAKTSAQYSFLNLWTSHLALEKSPATAIELALALGFPVKFVPHKNNKKRMKPICSCGYIGSISHTMKTVCHKCKAEFETWAKWADHGCVVMSR